MNNKLMKKVWAGILAVSMVLGLVCLPVNVQTAFAEAGDPVSAETRTVNLQIGGNISGISDPSVPGSADAEWSGSKVYFGKYANAPVLFRVLDANTTDYSADGTTKTMLLDSDILVDRKAFDSSSGNTWSTSTLRTWLQGTASGQFLNQFNTAERGAIIASYKAALSGTDGANGAFVPLDNDKVFLLDIAELKNTSYGYSNTSDKAINRLKKYNGSYNYWWTRSYFSTSVYIIHTYFDESSNNNAKISALAGSTAGCGVSPAMNLDLSSVLFTTVSGHDKASSFAATADAGDNDTWNLTLAGGNGFTATLDDSVIAAGENITVNVTSLGGGTYSQLSAMLVDENNTVLAYGKIKDTAATGEASFAVPAGIEKGSYTLKVFAEQINSSAANSLTDYASNMVSFDIDYIGAQSVNLQTGGAIRGISDPSAPVDNEAWSGSKVYFGKYANAPVLFRVLDANTTDYSADGTTKTMLLDSDVLYVSKIFDEDKEDNSWANSDIRTWMQGTGANQFMRQFSSIELNTIIESYKTAPSGTDGAVFSAGAFAPLNYDKVFVLDVAEVRNTSYGYSATDQLVTNRVKYFDNGAVTWWWTRSPLSSGGSDFVSFVNTNGKIGNAGITGNNTMGVSPAMNLDLSAVLFTTVSGQDKASSFAATADAGDNNTWNLTLAGGNGFVATMDDSVIEDGEDFSVNVTSLGGGTYSQLSAMLVDENNTVLAYGKIKDTAATGEVSFEAPAGLEKGRYTLKVFAEQVNSSAANSFTDYASNMISFTIDYLMETKNINLQIDGIVRGISDPSAPVDDAAWSGSKVYFGKYNNNPLLFRVLDANTTDYSEDGTTKTMLLDSDILFAEKKFDDGQTDNSWANSDIKTWMQGTGSGQFMRQFSSIEQNAIIESYKTEPSGTDGAISSGTFTPLDNDTVFALDVAELKSAKYGYSSIETAVTNRIKQLGGNDRWWWTRSPLSSGGKYYVRFVNTNGKIGNAGITDGHSMGVSPAMNLDLSSILYASASGTDQTSDLGVVGKDLVANNEWKLTLLDAGKTVGIQDNQNAYKIGTTVTVPYTYAGSDISQLSVMITSAERTSVQAEVLYYGKLEAVSNSAGSGIATFTLPAGLPEGYKIYIIAEDINAGNLTNYASVPVELDIVTPTELGTTYRNLDTADVYPVDFDNGAIVDGTVYPKGTTIGTTGDHEVIYTESGDTNRFTLVLYWPGDLNTDNEVSVVDLVVMKKYFLDDRDLSLSGAKAADITADGNIDSDDFDELVVKALDGQDSQVVFDRASYSINRYLSKSPAVDSIPAYNPTADEYAGIEAICYEGAPYKGEKTKVFAYIGFPEGASAGNKVPAVVLVHGAGGHAYAEWIKRWNAKGYAAIAMDTTGFYPTETGKGIAVTEDSNDEYWARELPEDLQEDGYVVPPTNQSYRDIGNLLEDQWMYHAIVDTVLAHNILLNDDRVDDDKIGISGVSWGSVVTSLALGYDDRYAFAVPIYGSAYLEKAPDALEFADKYKSDDVKKIWCATRNVFEIDYPVYWMCWLKDKCFSFISNSSSYLATKDQGAAISIISDSTFAHSHKKAWARPEGYRFADAVLSGQLPFIRAITEPQGTGEVRFAIEIPTGFTNVNVSLVCLTEAIRYGDDRSQYLSSAYTTTTVALSDNIVTAEIPSGAYGYYFEFSGIVNGDTVRSSTPYVELRRN